MREVRYSLSARRLDHRFGSAGNERIQPGAELDVIRRFGRDFVQILRLHKQGNGWTVVSLGQFGHKHTPDGAVSNDSE